MAPAEAGGVSFRDALRRRVEDTLDACTRCGKLQPLPVPARQSLTARNGSLGRPLRIDAI